MCDEFYTLHAIHFVFAGWEYTFLRVSDREKETILQREFSVCVGNIGVKCLKWRPRCNLTSNHISLGFLSCHRPQKGNWVLTTQGRRHIHNPLSQWYLITSGLWYVAFPQTNHYEFLSSQQGYWHLVLESMQSSYSMEMEIAASWKFVSWIFHGAW